MQQKELPIGYWLRKADQLLTKGADKVQADFGLTRASWMVVNTIAENKVIAINDCFRLLEPFTSQEQFGKLIAELKDRNLIKTKNGQLSLTTEGSGLHTECRAAQQLFRTKTLTGISDEAYNQTLSTLKRLVENIEPDNPSDHATHP